MCINIVIKDWVIVMNQQFSPDMGVMASRGGMGVTKRVEDARPVYSFDPDQASSVGGRAFAAATELGYPPKLTEADMVAIESVHRILDRRRTFPSSMQSNSGPLGGWNSRSQRKLH